MSSQITVYRNKFDRDNDVSGVSGEFVGYECVWKSIPVEYLPNGMVAVKDQCTSSGRAIIDRGDGDYYTGWQK